MLLTTREKGVITQEEISIDTVVWEIQVSPTLRDLWEPQPMNKVIIKTMPALNIGKDWFVLVDRYNSRNEIVIKPMMDVCLADRGVFPENAFEAHNHSRWFKNIVDAVNYSAAIAAREIPYRRSSHDEFGYWQDKLSTMGESSWDRPSDDRRDFSRS